MYSQTESLNPENALAVQHSVWLQHPCTKQMFQVLEKQKEFYAKRITMNAFAKDDDQSIIRSAVALATTQTTITVLKETDQFLSKLV